MLGYRHGFHAGNFADVLKHVVQVNIIEYLKQKDKPFCYIDTHAGAGLYDVKSVYMQKNAEYETGIGKLYGLSHLPDSLERYLSLVAEINGHQELRRYPGSPKIAQMLLREQDKIRCSELHPKDVAALQKLFRGDARAKVFEQDGYQSLKALLPPAQKRGLIMIDPSYELKSEYNQVTKGLREAQKRFATGVYAIWYPVIQRESAERFCRKLLADAVGPVLRLELNYTQDTPGKGMTGSGMLIIRPPYVLKDQMEQALPVLQETICQEGGNYRIDSFDI